MSEQVPKTSNDEAPQAAEVGEVEAAAQQAVVLGKGVLHMATLMANSEGGRRALAERGVIVEKLTEDGSDRKAKVTLQGSHKGRGVTYAEYPDGADKKQIHKELKVDGSVPGTTHGRVGVVETSRPSGQVDSQPHAAQFGGQTGSPAEGVPGAIVTEGIDALNDAIAAAKTDLTQANRADLGQAA